MKPKKKISPKRNEIIRRMGNAIKEGNARMGPVCGSPERGCQVRGVQPGRENHGETDL